MDNKNVVFTLLMMYSTLLAQGLPEDNRGSALWEEWTTGGVDNRRSGQQAEWTTGGVDNRRSGQQAE